MLFCGVAKWSFDCCAPRRALEFSIRRAISDTVKSRDARYVAATELNIKRSAAIRVNGTLADALLIHLLSQPPACSLGNFLERRKLAAKPARERSLNQQQVNGFSLSPVRGRKKSLLVTDLLRHFRSVL